MTGLSRRRGQPADEPELITWLPIGHEEQGPLSRALGHFALFGVTQAEDPVSLDELRAAIEFDEESGLPVAVAATTRPLGYVVGAIGSYVKRQASVDKVAVADVMVLAGLRGRLSAELEISMRAAEGFTDAAIRDVLQEGGGI